MQPAPEHRCTREELASLGARCASITAISAAAILSIDEEQRITLFNRGAAESLGYAAEEGLGEPLDILRPEGVRDIHRQHVREFGLSRISARQMGERGRIMGRRMGGELFPADASISQVEVGGVKIYTAVLRDITAAMHAQEALRQANNELSALIAASPLAIVVLDQEERVETWNPAAERLLGWSEAEVLGKAPPHIPSELYDEYRQIRERALHGMVTTGIQTRRSCKNGSTVAIRISVAPLSGWGGEVRGTIALLEDESERRQAEEAQRRLTAILEATPDLVSMADPEGHILYINEAGRRLLGRTDVEISGRIFAEFHPDWAASLVLREAIPTAIREGSWSGESAILSRDGHEIPVAQVVIAHRNANGQVDYLSTMMHEITARKQAEEIQQFLIEASRTLSASIEFDQVLRSITGIIVPRLADYCIIDLLTPNDRTEQPLAVHRDPAKQELVAQLQSYPARRGHLADSSRVFQTGAPEVVPEVTDAWLRASASDEEHYHILQQLRPVSELIVPLQVRGEVIGAISCAFAESGRHYSEDSLRLAESLAGRAALAIDNASLYRGLQQALRLRDEVLRIVAHDLRNPLNTISLSTGVLVESMPPELAAHCGPQLQVIQRATDRANRLIGDLLDVARMHAGRLSLELHPEETRPLMEEVLALQQKLAEERGLRLEGRFPEFLPAINCDRDRILQVFANLIGNAIKFTPRGGTITVGAEPRGDEIRFSVADTGPGIPEDEIPHLFESFWQARAGGGEGTGLGLTICKGIITAHGGRIWVESERGAGATFYFTLPLADSGAASSDDSRPAGNG
jgi:PAS domain S-box-containing protein